MITKTDVSVYLSKQMELQSSQPFQKTYKLFMKDS